MFRIRSETKVVAKITYVFYVIFLFELILCFSALPNKPVKPFIKIYSNPLSEPDILSNTRMTSGWNQSNGETTEKQVLLVLIIISRPEATHERLAIRETWALSAAACQIKIIFAFNGRFLHKLRPLQSTINEEKEKYNDVVQFFSLRDDYYENTQLIVKSLFWARETYPNVPFVGKANDDIWINFPDIITQLRRYSHMKKDFILGHFLDSTAPETRNFYEGFLFDDEIPLTFAVGHLWIMPMRTVPKLLPSNVKNININSGFADMVITGEIRLFWKIRDIDLPGYVDLWDFDNEITCSLMKFTVVHGVFSRHKYEMDNVFRSCPAQKVCTNVITF